MAKEPVKKNKTTQNVSVDPDILIEFYKYATPMGIKLSPWIQAKMIEFVNDRKDFEEMKAKRNSIQ